MIKFLISEHSLNRNLKEIFYNPIKFRKHLTVIDYLSHYINNKYNGNGISQIKFSESEFEDSIITNVIYDMERFKNDLKSMNKIKEDNPYIEFKHSDFIKATNSKIKDVEVIKILKDLSTITVNFNFPVCVISKDSCGYTDHRIKKCEYKKEIKNEKILNNYESIKHGKFDYKYKIILDTRFILYLINNIKMNHTSFIPTDAYHCTKVPTSSQLFMRRFISPYNFGRRNKKKRTIKYDTIRSETGFDKSNSYIRSHMLKPLIESGYIQTFYGNDDKVIIFHFNKVGNYIAKITKF